MVLTPKVNLGVTTCGYYGKKATSFAGVKCPAVGKMASTNRNLERPAIKCRMPVDQILWKALMLLVIPQLINKTCLFKV